MDVLLRILLDVTYDHVVATNVDDCVVFNKQDARNDVWF